MKNNYTQTYREDDFEQVCLKANWKIRRKTIEIIGKAVDQSTDLTRGTMAATRLSVGGGVAQFCSVGNEAT